MSSLLDQAIIDAKDLREAAMKSAEQSILEMYAPEVKKAVETILNTEEPIVEEVGEVSLAAADGENLCPCPKEDEPDELEIDFEKLEKMISDEEVGMGRDELAMDLGAEDELKLQEDADATEDVAEEELEEEFELSEELELEEDEEEEELEEEIKIDFDPTAKLGWFPPAESQEEYRAEMLAALDSLKAKEEELEENKNFQAVTKNKNIKISKALVKLQDRNEQYTNVILQLEEKINELLLINSRLLFTNRVLESISLNERQKTNLVEAISKSRTPEEAKTIFESLKNVVGSISQKQRGPQSLREATQVPFTGQVGASRRQQSISDDVKSRMQKLAGIGNNIQE